MLCKSCSEEVPVARESGVSCTSCCKYCVTFIKPRCACAASAYGSRPVFLCVCLFVTRISALQLCFGGR